MYTQRWRIGFTLIEIMVVVSIIGILSAVIYANFGDARTDAKNKALLAELKEVQLALELYKSQTGKYPPAKSHGGIGLGCTETQTQGAGPNTRNVSWTQGGTIAGGCLPSDPIINRLTPEFIKELPDPTDAPNPNCQLVYHVATTSGTWYKLTALNCYEGVVATSTGLQRCAAQCSNTVGFPCERNTTFAESPAIYSAGGECK